MGLTIDDREDNIPSTVVMDSKVEKGPTLDVWGKELNKDEVSAAYKTSQAAKDGFGRLQTQLESLNLAWNNEKSRGDEASLHRMIIIAHQVAALTSHLGGREYKKSMDKLDDDLRELVKKLQTTFDNPWGKTITYISIGVSVMGAACALAEPIDGVFGLAARSVGYARAPMAEATIKLLGNASQPIGTLATSISSASQFSEKALEKERQKVQHDQGVAQRTREENSQARSKAQEKAHEANRNMSDLDAAKHRAIEQQ